jgi:NAD(P)-dependent dehydrogenase (short-subunit alcohol dehydrogenase family)
MSSFDIRGKRVLITGGNTGIGKASATLLARRGAEVVFTSRDAARGTAALAEVRAESGRDDVELMSLDLGSFASIRGFADEYRARHQRLDVLINNAGVIVLGERQLSADGFERMFGVNHLGHFLLTDLLLDVLRASAPSRIVVLSSEGYKMAPDGLNFDDLQSEREYNGFALYGHSKLANVHFTTELARRLAGTGITVNAVHPGYVETELGHTRPEDRSAEKKAGSGAGAREGAPDLSHLPPPMSAADGAATSLFVACDPSLDGVTGEYFSECKSVPLTPMGANVEAAGRLWEVSEKLISAARA